MNEEWEFLKYELCASSVYNDIVPWQIYKDNIKIELKNVDVNWLDMAQNKNHDK